MNKKFLKQALLSLGVMLTALMVFNVVAPAALANLSVGDVPAALEGAPTDIRELAKDLLGYLLGFLGLIAVIFIIYAGFLYVTAAGNDENIGKAKNIILYTVVGIIVILASAAIVNFALDATSGATETVQTAPAGTL